MGGVSFDLKCCVRTFGDDLPPMMTTRTSFILIAALSGSVYGLWLCVLKLDAFVGLIASARLKVVLLRS